MSSASWKTFLASQLKINIEQQGLSSTYTSLATVRPDGTPANRTVVFRFEFFFFSFVFYNNIH